MRFEFILTSAVLLLAHERGTSGQQITVELVADGLGSPIDLVFSPDGAGNRYIVDQNGYVYLLDKNNAVNTDVPFLDISSKVEIQSAFDERGLLSIAFHPKYAENSLVYALYSSAREEENICYGLDGAIPTNSSGCPYQHRRVISEFQVVDGKVDNTTEKRIFDMVRVWSGPFAVLIFDVCSHNAPFLFFYRSGPIEAATEEVSPLEGTAISTLDWVMVRCPKCSARVLPTQLACVLSNISNDHEIQAGIVYGPEGRDDSITPVVEALFFGDFLAGDLTSFFGKILRLDVDTDGTVPYTVPITNPFANTTEFPDYKSEIYSWGVRNPFRISFDLQDGNNGTTFYMSSSADTFFEATFKVTGPGNLGWSTREGSHCVVRSQPLTPPEFVPCSADTDCPQGPQNTTCGTEGFCTCPTEDALGYPLTMPYLEYINFAANNYNETEALLKEGKLEQPKGSASLGGHVYRGSAIPWLVGKFIQADFAVDFLDGLIFIVTEAEDGTTTVRDGYTFNKDDPEKAGFVKSIGSMSCLC
jgi:hypothetical protein